MPKRTDISSSLVIGAAKPLPGGEELGWGSEAVRPRVDAGVEPPSPTLPQWGRGLRRVVFEPVVAIGVEGEFFGDPLNNAVGVLQHFVVPETDHLVALGLDHPGARFVGWAIAMLPSIDFDHQFEAAAGEVDDGPANLKFPRELNAQLLSAQSRPQPDRSVGRLASQLLRDRRKTLPDHSNTPPKLPSPMGKGWGWGFRASSGRRTPTQPSPSGRALLAPIAKSA